MILGSEFEEDCISSEDSYSDIPDSYVESLSMLIICFSLFLNFKIDSNIK